MWESDPAQKGIVFSTRIFTSRSQGELFVRDTAGFLSYVVSSSEIPAKETHLPGYILFKQRSSFRELAMDADRGCTS
jgi:hypothetical protein